MRTARFVAVLVVAGILAFGLSAYAQQPAAPKEHSMGGCLAAGAAPNTFKLTNVDKVNTVDIAKSSVNLAPHVGHKIEITGTAVPGKETHTMEVTAIKMVSTTCP
jgi:hypothetical protein